MAMIKQLTLLPKFLTIVTIEQIIAIEVARPARKKQKAVKA